MNTRLTLFVVLAGTVLLLSSCRTAAPRLDYRALANASVKLGMDIDLRDNHRLYTEVTGWIGTPYRMGGDTKRGTDCSGFTRQIYKTVYHKSLDRNSESQRKQCKKVAKHQLKEGDLVFFSSNNSGKKVAHVGIYLKDGKFVHASTSRGVIVSKLSENYYKTHWICGGRR